MTPSAEPSAAAQLVATMRQMMEKRLNVGAAGNASCRHSAGGMWITPTGIPSEQLTPEQIVHVADDGAYSGPWRPSSEWHFHLAIYQARPEIAAIVHCHAPAATAVACHRRDLPPFHYMIAEFGGTTVRCSRYARFGTPELAAAILEALVERKACLIANHGLIATGKTLAEALHLAEALEALCLQYLYAQQLGEPIWLTESEMADALAAFRTYGQQPAQERTSTIRPPSS